MTGENFSVTKCSLNKRQGDQVVDIKISNQNEENAKRLISERPIRSRKNS